MSYQYDVLLQNGTVVDYASDREAVMDVAVVDGKIAEIAPELNPTQARDVFDVSGQHVVPGIIDLHTHFSSWVGGRYGHKMLALAGVTAAPQRWRFPSCRAMPGRDLPGYAPAERSRVRETIRPARSAAGFCARGGARASCASAAAGRRRSRTAPVC